MKIDVRDHSGDVLILSLKGALDREGARKLTRFLSSRQRRGVTRLRLDLAVVDFIGLSGLVTLNDICTVLSRRGGGLVLENVSGAVLRVLNNQPSKSCWTLENPHQD